MCLRLIMKVILQADVKGLGKKGEAVEVAEGYGRNYLIPRKLAFEASSAALKQAELNKEAARRKELKEEEKAKELAREIKGKVVTLVAKGGDKGKLYGAVTAKDVTDAINKALNLNLDKRKVELNEPIKSTGTFDVSVKLHPGVSTDLTVSVVLDKE